MSVTPHSDGKLQTFDIQTWIPQQSDIIPPNVRHFDAIAGLDLDAVLEPFPRHFFIRHFTLEYSLFSSLHCQVSYALQNLQLLI